MKSHKEITTPPSEIKKKIILHYKFNPKKERDKNKAQMINIQN
jgi:hypothetical protein